MKPYIFALIKACKKLNIEYRFVDEYSNFLEVNINNRWQYFIGTRTPFNNETLASICLNKFYTYLLLKDELPMPKTIGYLDPDTILDLKKYLKFKSKKEIVKDIQNEFEFPMIVKMNSGAQGKHVYKCDSPRKIMKSLKAIFNKKHKNYDFSLLAQQFLNIENEYRVILLDGEIILLYEKVSKEKNRNLSPLHNEDGKAVLINDDSIYKKISEIVNNSPRLQQMPYIGLDIAKDFDNNWWVLELNTHPGFSYFIRDNGDGELVKMYEKVLNKLQNGK